ncbi:MAG: hypothetical protein AB7V47_00220 [Phycisphaerales bacterium]
MVDLDTKTHVRVGPYILTRELTPGAMGSRHLALHALDNSSHVVHLLPTGRDRYGQRRFLAAMAHAESLAKAVAPTPGGQHILRIEDHGLDTRGQAWVVTPFTGDARGIVSLEAHLREKGGFLPAFEAREALVHLCQAVAAAHAAGFAHGELHTESVVVDRRGSLLIEGYGVPLLLRDGLEAMSDESIRRAEVRSIARIAYRLVTGLLPEEPIIPAGRVVTGLDPWWDAWLDTALYSEPGFRSSAHALSAIADRSIGEYPSPRSRSGVRSVIRRFLFAGV